MTLYSWWYNRCLKIRPIYPSLLQLERPSKENMQLVLCLSGKMDILCWPRCFWRIRCWMRPYLCYLMDFSAKVRNGWSMWLVWNERDLKNKAGVSSCKMMLNCCINRLYCRGWFHCTHCHIFWDSTTSYLFTAWSCRGSLFCHTGALIDAYMVHYRMACCQVTGSLAWKAPRLYVRRFR